MKALACTWLVMGIGCVACSSGGDQGDGTQSAEDVAGAGGSPSVGAEAGGGGTGNTAGHPISGAGGGGGALAGGSGGSASMGGAAGATSVASTPCPTDSASCPKTGGLTPPCGAGHCTDASGKAIVQATTYDTCHPDRIPSMGVGHPVNAMKGTFLPTLHGSEGDDDQCKYHVTIALDAAAQNQDVNFTLTATNLGDGSVVKDNAPEPAVDVFLSASHLAPKTDVMSTMTSPGKFKVGPVRFNQCGEWTARFHFFNHCGNDFTDSPYASIAFYVNVP